MLRKLKLYGELAKFIGHKEFEIKVHNLPQAISFLRNNFPEVESYMNPKYYQVRIGDYEINKDELNFPIGQQDIHIIPVISGAGGDTFNTILIGGLLIGASFFFPGAGLFGTQSFSGALAAGSQSAIPFVGATGVAGSAIGTAIGTGLSAIGAGLVLQGVGNMLYPTQDPTFEDNPQISFNFAGTQNTARAGTPVPIVYGEIFTGSVVISGDVDTEAVQV
jgi:predicted phage tail protein